MITDIKDRTKLQSMLKDAIRDRDYYFNCIDDVGRILEKHSFSWDGKPKNLEIYADKVIAKYERLHKCLREIKEILCKGRTFYDGYFDAPYENLSRIDQAIKKIAEVDNE